MSAKCRPEKRPEIALIDAGSATFEVHLTPGAIDSLRIEAGKQIWLVIKTRIAPGEGLVAGMIVSRQ